MNAGFKQKRYLDLDQVERDFCSARQAYVHAQQKEVAEKREGGLCFTIYIADFMFKHANIFNLLLWDIAENVEGKLGRGHCPYLTLNMYDLK